MKLYVSKGIDTYYALGKDIDISTTPKPGYEEMTLEELTSLKGRVLWCVSHRCFRQKFNWQFYYADYDQALQAIQDYTDGYSADGFEIEIPGPEVLNVKKNGKTVVHMCIYPIIIGQESGGRYYRERKKTDIL